MSVIDKTDKTEPSTFAVLTSNIPDVTPFFDLPPLPSPKRWLEIFAQSFLWAITFFVIRRAYEPVDQESQIFSAGNAALLGFVAFFLRGIAYDLVWKNYFSKRYDDNLQRKQK